MAKLRALRLAAEAQSASASVSRAGQEGEEMTCGSAIRRIWTGSSRRGRACEEGYQQRSSGAALSYWC